MRHEDKCCEKRHGVRSGTWKDGSEEGELTQRVIDEDNVFICAFTMGSSVNDIM